MIRRTPNGMQDIARDFAGNIYLDRGVDRTCVWLT